MNRRRVGFAVGLAAIVLLVSGALVEIVLRVYAHSAEGALALALRADPYEVQVEPHGNLGFRPRAERTFQYSNGAGAHTNPAGFRGPMVARPKPTGTFRVILLGGSTTFGWGVGDHETIDRHMSQLLAERHPGRAFEVVNLAFDGYDSYQLLERLQTDGIPLEPDAVIVNTGVNDVSHAWLRDIQDGDRRNTLYLATLDELRLEAERGGPRLWTRAKHWLYAARVPGWLRATRRRATERSLAAHLPRPTPHWDLLEYFERNLRRLAEVGASDSAVVLFSSPPSSLRTRYEPREPPRAYYWIIDAETTQVYRDSLDARMQAVTALLKERGLQVGYVPHGELPPALFLDDAHLTPEGNRRVAEDFVDALEPWIERSTLVQRR